MSNFGRMAFMSQVKAIFGSEDAADIEMMYLLAKKFSEGQFRKELGEDGKPLRYFEHPKRVALKLIEYGCRDAEIICAALAHDLIEDADSKDLANMLLNRAFPRLANLHSYVQTVTKIPKMGYIEKLEEAANIGNLAVLVKMADRLDNLNSLPDDYSFVIRQIDETSEKMIPVFSTFLGKINGPNKTIGEYIFKDIKLSLSNARKIIGGSGL